jgi:arabinogalactan endo-1,4-beta-galactosidase
MKGPGAAMRRRLLRYFAAGMASVAGLLMVSPLHPVQPPPAAVSIVGADISSALQQEAANNHVRSQGEILPIEDILSRNGVNYARLRLWVNPTSGTGDLESALALAKRAKAAGLDLLLDLHYSDTWADQHNQQIPAAWSGLDLPELAEAVRTYTKEVVDSFARQGTPVGIVQVGNEVTHGMLWPWGQIQLSWGEWWDGFATLVKAGATGAREGQPGDPPLIMLHAHTGGDLETTVEFFDKVRRNDMPFDIIGLTYYPFWGGSLANLSRNLDALATRYGRDIILVETAYPWTLDSTDGGSSVVTSADQLPDGESYPATPAGQAAFFRALRSVLASVPNGHGAGYFVWEPGWLPGVAAGSEVGNRYSNLTLFDWSGNGLPALGTLNPRREAGQ